MSLAFAFGVAVGIKAFNNKTQTDNSHERQEAVGSPFFNSSDTVTLKCLNHDRKSRASMDTETTYVKISWKPPKDLCKQTKFLSEKLLEITVSDQKDPHTGRKILYQLSKNADYLNLVGIFSEYYKVKYSEPDTYLIKGTNWVVSEEVSASGTGLSERWGRYWLLDDRRLREVLAIPVSGKQEMSTEDPVRSYKIEAIPEKCEDSRIYFSIHATCKILYGDRENESIDLNELLLKDVHGEICFEKDYKTSKFSLNESISTISLSQFRSITNLEMKFDGEFFELYGSEIIKMLNGSLETPVRMWLKYGSISSAIREDPKWKSLFAK